MSNEVVFENEENPRNEVANIQIVRGAPTGMLAWLVKNNIAKDGRQAEMFLVVVCIVLVVVAITVFIMGNPPKIIVKDFSKTDIILPSSPQGT